MENIKLTTFNIDEKDDYVTVFEVSREWLKNIVKQEFDMTLQEFMSEYIYDTAEIVYYIALNENRILSIQTEKDIF